MTGILEVEDAEQRLDRLQNAFQRLNNTTPCKPVLTNLSLHNVESTLSKPQFIPPPTDLLSRVQAFLPALEASNALLSSQDPTDLDIEHIDGSPGPYIEMNLGLGLFDVTGSTSPSMNVSDVPTFPLSKSPSASSDSSTSITSSSSMSSDDWDSDESSDTEIITSFKSVRPLKPLPRRAIRQMQTQLRPGIVVLGENSSTSKCCVRNAEEG